MGSSLLSPPMMALGLKVTADNRQGPPVGTPNYPTV
jgi:hypothetical protein